MQKSILKDLAFLKEGLQASIAIFILSVLVFVFWVASGISKDLPSWINTVLVLFIIVSGPSILFFRAKLKEAKASAVKIPVIEKEHWKNN